MSSSISNIVKPPTIEAFAQSNCITYGCPIDGFTFYLNSPIHPDHIQAAVSRNHDKKASYKYMTYLPDRAGWIMFEKKNDRAHLKYDAIARINPSKGLLTYTEFESLIYGLVEHGNNYHNILAARIDYKLDLFGWTNDQVDQIIWAKNLPRRDDLHYGTTTYYGRNRSIKQVKVYDKAAELNINIPEGLTRVEYTHKYKTPYPFRELSFLLALQLNPFENVILVDMEPLDGRTTMKRRFNAGESFMDILAAAPTESEKNKIRRYAETNKLYDLASIFKQTIWSWYHGTMPLPTMAGGPPGTPEEIEEEMAELLYDLIQAEHENEDDIDDDRTHWDV